MEKIRPAVLAVSGVKNSGKTTLIEGLLPRLAAEDLRVAVIKHDGHHFTPDTPGTDSYRCFAAGACGTAVFDGEKFSLTRRCAVDETALLTLFPDADLVLLEGFKDSLYPKIEVVRAGVSEAPVCDPASCIAVVSDLDLESPAPVLRPGDWPGILALVLQAAGIACGY